MISARYDGTCRHESSTDWWSRKLVRTNEKALLFARAFQGWKTGLEPATFGTTIRRSNRLSYNHRFGNAKIRYIDELWIIIDVFFTAWRCITHNSSTIRTRRSTCPADSVCRLRSSQQRWNRQKYSRVDGFGISSSKRAPKRRAQWWENLSRQPHPSMGCPD